MLYDIFLYNHSGWYFSHLLLSRWQCARTKNKTKLFHAKGFQIQSQTTNFEENEYHCTEAFAFDPGQLQLHTDSNVREHWHWHWQA